MAFSLRRNLSARRDQLPVVTAGGLAGAGAASRSDLTRNRDEAAQSRKGIRTWHAARKAFGWTESPNEYGNYCPLRLAEPLREGNGRRFARVEQRVSYAYKGG